MAAMAPTTHGLSGRLKKLPGALGVAGLAVAAGPAPIMAISACWRRAGEAFSDPQVPLTAPFRAGSSNCGSALSLIGQLHVYVTIRNHWSIPELPLPGAHSPVTGRTASGGRGAGGS